MGALGGFTDLPPDLICFTVGVDWAAPPVLGDLLRFPAERKLRAAFSCTHAGIALPGDERALHANFRRNGETLRTLRSDVPPGAFVAGNPARLLRMGP
jgi:hypothetical protein